MGTCLGETEANLKDLPLPNIEIIKAIVKENKVKKKSQQWAITCE